MHLSFSSMCKSGYKLFLTIKLRALCTEAWSPRVILLLINAVHPEGIPGLCWGWTPTDGQSGSFHHSLYFWKCISHKKYFFNNCYAILTPKVLPHDTISTWSKERNPRTLWKLSFLLQIKIDILSQSVHNKSWHQRDVTRQPTHVLVHVNLRQTGSCSPESSTSY